MDFNKIITDNMGLVASIVKKFRPKNHIEYDEMMAAGRIALWQAAQKFQPEKGAFTTIAYRRIYWNIFAYLRKKRKNILEVSWETGYFRRPSDEFIEEQKGNIQDFLPANLSDLEKEIILSLAAGHKKSDIYKEMNITQGKFEKIFKTAIRKIEKANI